MGDFDFGGSPGGTDRYSRAMDSQGFKEPTSRSPVDAPPGWKGGQVDQTGGMVMVRRWYTEPGMSRVHDSRPGRQYEYEVAYGQDPGVSLQRYEWSGRSGAYEFDGVVESVPVQNNSDRAKAEAALRLMRKHSDKTK